MITVYLYICIFVYYYIMDINNGHDNKKNQFFSRYPKLFPIEKKKAAIITKIII